MAGAINAVMRMLGWPIVLGGLAMAAAAIWSGVPPLWTWATGDTAIGRIGTTGYTRTHVRTGNVAHLERVVVTFTARDGREYTVRDPMSQQGGGLDAGERVRVAYDRDDPTDAVILARLPWRLGMAVFLAFAALASLITGGLLLLGARLPWVSR
jgi:hypothetical protein